MKAKISRINERHFSDPFCLFLQVYPIIGFCALGCALSAISIGKYLFASTHTVYVKWPMKVRVFVCAHFVSY